MAETGSRGAVTSELALSCRLNRATAWRLLWTLASHGLVVHDRADTRWRLGMAVLDIARSAGLDGVLHDVREVLQSLSLQTGETAALATSQAGGLAYVEEVTPAVAVAVSWVGRPISLHATSTGKVLLAWSHPDELEALLTSGLERFTDTTVTDPVELREHLRLTRSRGWATCEGEYAEDAWGASAPVLGPDDRLVAVLSVWGPSSRVPPSRLPVLGDLVAAAAKRVGAG